MRKDMRRAMTGETPGETAARREKGREEEWWEETDGESNQGEVDLVMYWTHAALRSFEDAALCTSLQKCQQDIFRSV